MPQGKAPVQPVEKDEQTFCVDYPWKCFKCSALLGYIDAPTKQAVRVKMRNFFLWIVEPKIVSMPCRICGAYNYIADETVEAAWEQGALSDAPRLAPPTHLNGSGVLAATSAEER